MKANSLVRSDAKSVVHVCVKMCIYENDMTPSFFDIILSNNMNFNKFIPRIHMAKSLANSRIITKEAPFIRGGGGGKGDRVWNL